MFTVLKKHVFHNKKVVKLVPSLLVPFLKNNWLIQNDGTNCTLIFSTIGTSFGGQKNLPFENFGQCNVCVVL